jgi:tripartite-type tricarboxylate transporter receptor subunit TctC
MVVLIRSTLLAILAFACAGTAAVAQQKFPNGTVRIVAPYVPGGAVDIAARALADLLSERWSSPVIVENRTGAATAIGTNAVATATADGHTLLLTATPFLVNPTLQPTLPYDTLRDFAGISMVVEQPVALVAHPSVPANTLRELVADAKTNDQTLA